MKRWRNLKHWQKGAIIGALIGVILPVVFFITFETIDSLTDIILKIYYLPRIVSENILEDAPCNWCLWESAILQFVFGLIQLTLLGMITGFLITQFKKLKKSR